MRSTYFFALKTKKIESELVEIENVSLSLLQAASETAVFS